MHTPFRVLIAVPDEKIRISAEGLLRTMKAEFQSIADPTMLLTYVGTPDGVDLLVVDGASKGISIETIYRTARSKPKPTETYIVVLVEGADTAAALLAFNAGADAVLRKPIDPVAFLNACRAGQRVAVMSKMQRVVMDKVNDLAARHVPPPPQAAPEATAAASAPPESSQVVLSGGSKKAPGDSEPPVPVYEDEGLPILIQQMECAMTQAFVDQGVPDSECGFLPPEEGQDRGAFVGWQGVFWPPSNQWFDFVFHGSQAAVEYLGQWMTGRIPRSSEEMLRSMSTFLGSLQSVYKSNYETGYGAASTVLCQPASVPSPEWIIEGGAPVYSQVFRFPESYLVCDFYVAPATLRVKGMAEIIPGDVLNETVAASGQHRIPLANRGVIFSEESIAKVRAQLDTDRNLWVISPSFLGRRFGTV